MLKKLAILMLLLALLGLAACSKPKKEAPEPEELDTQKPLTICFDLDNNPPKDPRHYDFDSGDMKYIGGRLKQGRKQVPKGPKGRRRAGERPAGVHRGERL